MSFHTHGVFAWAMADNTAAEVAEKIRTLPEDLQPWVARIVWWDKYSHLYTKTNELMHWVRTHSTDNPDPDRLQQALMDIGYTEHLARVRACGGDGAEERMVTGVPLEDIRTLDYERRMRGKHIQNRVGRGVGNDFYRVSLPKTAGWQ